MGCCFSGGDDEKTNHKTPLISSRTDEHGTYTNDTSKSARQYKPDKDKEKEFLTSVDLLSAANMKEISVPSLNKTFQDQGKVFDEIFRQFQSMKENLNNFKSHYTSQTAGIPVLSKCVALLVEQCGDCKLSIERRKYSVIIGYENREVMRNSTANPQQVLDCLQLFNAVNRSIQKILDRAPEVEHSANILLDDEDNMRKEVTKADLSGPAGPEALHVCNDNIQKLRHMNSHLKTIKKHTDKTFKEVMEASKAFFKDK